MTLYRQALMMALEEENPDGKNNKEIEIVYYGKLTDMSQLEKATSKEDHEQWEIKIKKNDKNAVEGRIRVRKTTKSDDSNSTSAYNLTAKTKGKKFDGDNEVCTPASPELFRQFQLMAETGMIKTRYHFEVDNHVFELDVFKKPDGGYHEYVKVDIELTAEGEAIPELPFKLDELITNQESDQTEEEKKKIEKLYKDCFLTTNIVVSNQDTAGGSNPTEASVPAETTDAPAADAAPEEKKEEGEPTPKSYSEQIRAEVDKEVKENPDLIKGEEKKDEEEEGGEEKTEESTEETA